MTTATVSKEQVATRELECGGTKTFLLPHTGSTSRSFERILKEAGIWAS